MPGVVLFTALIAISGVMAAVASAADAADAAAADAASESTRPNIVWIIPDDMSAHFGCYGETAIATPHVDALAARGVRFDHAYVTAPVCSPCRSAFITGMYQTTIGAHHHRSGRGKQTIRLPDAIPLVPRLFQQAGYYTTIADWPPRKTRSGTPKLGKTDYNFQYDPTIYDGAVWDDREPGQPFFAQVQTPGGKLRGGDAAGWERVRTKSERLFGQPVPEEAVTLPPYYPNDPALRTDWAAYLDSVRQTDHMVGEVIAKLDADGDLDNTLVLFMTDHGISHIRGKQYLYDEGIHVPLVIAGPGIEAGTVRSDPVEHIDIAALSLAAAGIPLPTAMQARDILAGDYQPRDAVFAARDRCDETVDRIRSVRTNGWKYIRNYHPERPHLQPNAYKDHKAISIAFRAIPLDELTPVQAALRAPTRPAEELYDLAADRHERVNLAGDPDHAERLAEMRRRLADWESHTGDRGRQPESESMYDSDMAVYFDQLRGRHPERMAELQANIERMKAWAAAGK